MSYPSVDSISFFQEYREKVLIYLNLDSEDILSNMVCAITFDKTGYKAAGIAQGGIKIDNECGIDEDGWF